MLSRHSKLLLAVVFLQSDHVLHYQFFYLGNRVKVNLDQWCLPKKNYGYVLVSVFLGMRSWRGKRLFRTEYMSECSHYLGCYCCLRSQQLSNFECIDMSNS